MELSTILVGTVMAALPLIGAGLLAAMIVLERPYPVATAAEHRSRPAQSRARRQLASKRVRRT
jgi:hypothetical protein